MSTSLDAFDLTGRKALVIGGSRGMGRSMCLTLAAAGAEVMVSSRKLEACEQVVQEIRDAGGTAHARACHIGHWDALEELTDAAYQRMGRVDILINNAGMSPLYPSLVEVTEDLYDKVMAVNLRAPFRLSALIGTRMVADGGGVIILVSSVSATRAGHGAVPYAAAKAGVNSLTAELAHEFGPTVRVNCIMPGAFLTDISQAWDPADFDQLAQSYALKRGAQPEEIAGTVLYLASDASSFTTGTVLGVHGGHP